MPSARQQSPVIRDSPPAIRESSPAIRWQNLSCNREHSYTHGCDLRSNDREGIFRNRSRDRRSKSRESWNDDDGEYHNGRELERGRGIVMDEKMIMCKSCGPTREVSRSAHRDRMLGIDHEIHGSGCLESHWGGLSLAGGEVKKNRSRANICRRSDEPEALDSQGDFEIYSRSIEVTGAGPRSVVVNMLMIV